MTPEVWANRNNKLFLLSEAELQYIPHRRYEAKRFVLHNHRKERQVTRPTFLETNYDELERLIGTVLLPNEVCKVMMATPVEDTELTPEDTKELDEFLNSFSRT